MLVKYNIGIGGGNIKTTHLYILMYQPEILV